MSKNLIPEIARMLGVEIGEEFEIKGREYIFHFVDNGLIAYRADGSGLPHENCLTHFLWLINGEEEIVKIPWKPKRKDKYWTFYINGHNKLDTCWNIWTEEIAEFARLKAGWIYRSRAEAQAALPTAAKEMGVDYEL